MFDAEIAAKLLNRWENKLPESHAQAPLELLNEGNLSFSRHLGKMWAVPTEAEEGLEIECLMFADGSRAVRLSEGASEHPGWTRWTAIEPLRELCGDPAS